MISWNHDVWCLINVTEGGFRRMQLYKIQLYAIPNDEAWLEQRLKTGRSSRLRRILLLPYLTELNNSIRGFVRPSDRPCDIAHFWCCRCDCLCVWVCVGWTRAWMGVLCPYPPIRYDIVTPRHLFITTKGILGKVCRGPYPGRALSLSATGIKVDLVQACNRVRGRLDCELMRLWTW